MALYNEGIQPRHIIVDDKDKEQKKKVKLFIGNISEREALIVFEEDLEEKRNINYMKSLARGSYEYKEYMKNFKENLQYTSCMIFGIDTSLIPVSLEVHHTPFAMETIVKAVAYKQFIEAKGKPIDTKDVAEEVMRLHYEGKVGLIPLTTTMHEAVHSGTIYIKPSDIFGDYTSFYKEYEKYLDEDAINHYNNVIGLDDDVVDLYNGEKLKRIISEYDIEYEVIDKKIIA